MELSRLELARRLLGAQEAERGRIARELHDGIGQEIALLGIQMQRASSSASPESGIQKPTMQQFSSKLGAIGVHVSHLSHQLHSSELEYLGLAVAITKLCREFSEQYPIRLTCACRHIPKDLNNDIALTVLRIVQESLHNIAKHSGAKLVQVDVSGTADELILSVQDDGIGFDVQKTRPGVGLGVGLGLVSMRERIYLLGGIFTIDSAGWRWNECAGSCSPGNGVVRDFERVRFFLFADDMACMAASSGACARFRCWPGWLEVRWTLRREGLRAWLIGLLLMRWPHRVPQSVSGGERR